MKVYLCDRCKATLQDGPVGAYDYVNVQIQPSYLPTEHDIRWHLCKVHADMLHRVLMSFVQGDTD